jgi:hypothetical protein
MHCQVLLQELLWYMPQHPFSPTDGALPTNTLTQGKGIPTLPVRLIMTVL